MDHLLDADVAIRLLALKGFTAKRESQDFTVYDQDGKQVARCLVDIHGRIARHAIKHLL